MREAQPQSFYARLPGAFTYPFKGPGLWIIVGWLVFRIVLWVLGLILSIPPYMGVISMALAIFALGYICAYMLKLIVSSAAGEEEPPDWPEVSSFWDDILRPLLLVIATGVAVFLPLWIYMIVLFWSPGGFEAMTAFPLAMVLLWALGAFLLPMALLGVAMHSNLSGLNPVRIVVSIAKVFGPYLVTCILLALATAGRYAYGFLPRIPIASAVLSEAVAMYSLMVEMRLIGLIYHSYSLRLNWFDEAGDRRARMSP